MADTFGVDVGGTKIEAKVFDAAWNTLRSRRVPTPDRYDDLVAALTDLVGWLRGDRAGRMRIGFGLPGYIDPATGESMTTNIDANGRGLRHALSAIPDVDPVFENDCNCFALSEAVLGAGRGYRTVVGLILGTGVGGGIVIDGRLLAGTRGVVGEFGHIGIPATLANRYRLPMVTCGCGRIGCYETLASGRGLPRLCEALTGRRASGREIAAEAAAGSNAMQGVLDVWGEIVAELISAIQCIADPDCIVLGGGLSGMAGVEERLRKATNPILLPAIAKPAILRPEGGDSSGTRGAALLTQENRS
ncbi:MAG: ROK family protein [Proteobacteria bacterium]|nr:ROK family protein [Pseudomonadota bacterium]